jgi:hypothetical protein
VLRPPAVVETYLGGSLVQALGASAGEAPAGAAHDLSPEEVAVLEFLRGFERGS